MTKTTLIGSPALLLLFGISASADDVVTFRDRTAHGDRVLQTVRGRIEGETLAGIKVAGKTISAGDVVTVDYEMPGGIRLDARDARQDEDAKRWEEAAKKYRQLIAAPPSGTYRSFKPHFEFRLAWVTSQAADRPAALTILKQVLAAHPDRWERVLAAKNYARLALDAEPPDYSAAHNVFQDLAKAATADEQLRNDCLIAQADLCISENKRDEALKILATVAAGDPRVAVYRLAADADGTRPAETIAKLNALAQTAENATKPAVYALLGEAHSRDARTGKDALFAFLKVDLVYSGDWYQSSKAQARLAQLFEQQGHAERAKSYRDKSKGR